MQLLILLSVAFSRKILSFAFRKICIIYIISVILNIHIKTEHATIPKTRRKQGENKKVTNIHQKYILEGRAILERKMYFGKKNILLRYFGLLIRDVKKR